MMRFIQGQFDELWRKQDEATAMLINAVSPTEQFSECSYCRRLTTKPFRTYDEHGDDFCSVECLHEYIEDLEEDIDTQARESADSNIPKKYKQLWKQICDQIYDNACGYEHRGVIIKDIALEIIGDEEQWGVCEDENGNELKYYFAATGNHILECHCPVCQNDFQIVAQKFLKNNGHACSKCKGIHPNQNSPESAKEN
jgi:hypothetical protein